VHFSDTPPAGGAQQIEADAARSDGPGAAPAQATAIPYRKASPSPRLALVEVRLDLQTTPCKRLGLKTSDRRTSACHNPAWLPLERGCLVRPARMIEALFGGL